VTEEPKVMSLREWRARRLLSLDGLADKAGVSNKTIVQIEYGRLTPRVGTVRSLCDALNVEPEQVAEFVDAMEKWVKDAA
jgi:DNA-binding XRE family transcriptional regulator